MFVQLPDEVLQVFEWTNHWRQIWTDGRKIPEHRPLLVWIFSRQMEATFVVPTVGLDSENGWTAGVTRLVMIAHRTLTA